MSRYTRPPWWFIALIFIALMPVFSLPAMLSACPSGDSTLRTYITFYPVALVASAYYSWVSYTPRTLLAWIMLIFMYLIDASMMWLSFTQ